MRRLAQAVGQLRSSSDRLIGSCLVAGLALVSVVAIIVAVMHHGGGIG